MPDNQHRELYSKTIFHSKTTKKQHLNNCKQTQLVFFAVLYYLRTIIYNKTII